MALRFDLGTLRPAKRMADGRVRAEAHIARIGIQEYVRADGRVIRELRPRDEVMSQASLDSFALVPVTNHHPPEPNGVTADNARRYMVGALGEKIIADDDHVRAPLMVADKLTIEAMDAGDVEVSAGYTCDLDETSGTDPVFGRYDAIQRNIRGNHVAVALPVGMARAGSKARVRMDDAIAFARERSSRAVRMDDVAFVRRADAELTTAVDGHQHLIDLQPSFGDRMSGTTSWSMAEGADAGHEHAWVRNSDGTITIAEAAGHTHALIDRPGMDSRPPTGQDHVDHKPRRRGTAMPIKRDTKNDKLTIEIAAEELRKAETRADTAEESLAREKKRADDAEGRVDSLEKEIEALKANQLDEKEIAKRDSTIETLTKKLAKETSRADAAESPERFQAGVKRRVKIVQASAAILGDKMVVDTATDRELMCAVVEKLHGVSIDKERSDDYVTARFDAAVEGFMQGGDMLERLREITRGKEPEVHEDTGAAARAKYVQRQQDAWKTKSATAK